MADQTNLAARIGVSPRLVDHLEGIFEKPVSHRAVCEDDLPEFNFRLGVQHVITYLRNSLMAPAAEPAQLSPLPSSTAPRRGIDNY